MVSMQAFQRQNTEEIEKNLETTSEKYYLMTKTILRFFIEINLICLKICFLELIKNL